ncbi:hypothetical protein GCK72_002937 [Caenorhabditis remanei]|uniref:Uncharacterized protein n=1 Tax=Caenorhabditis remanei TaxID=31234 RepID=A0A6A5HY70_CAERE|nr:hypothetical protein GCK72_002937 [Caenorhabditis remanei]KAF1771112.1 hypothetical protein GCK72_002937 [Caenorhabditis remanei]
MTGFVKTWFSKSFATVTHETIFQVTWSFQPSRCELLSRVDETIHERVKFVSKTSVCTHQDLCSQSTSVITGITCDEFMKVLN